MSVLQGRSMTRCHLAFVLMALKRAIGSITGTPGRFYWAVKSLSSFCSAVLAASLRCYLT